jgi:homogentisate phytyltransferase/homogentisate geranylgeranyltransferase
MTLIGIIIAGHLYIDVMDISSPFHAGNIGMLGISLFTIIFLWQYAVMINHVYDVEIDRITNKERLLPQGLLSRERVEKIAVIYALVAVGLSFMLGLPILIIALISLLLGTIYSVPPLRLRASVFGTTIIGLGSMIAFFLGYLTPHYEYEILPVAIEVVKAFPSVTLEAIGLGLLVFINLSIGPLVTDLKDYEGDRKSGVKSIYTIFGVEKGVFIVSVLLFFAFLSPLILFHKLYDLFIFVPLAVVVTIAFNKYKNQMLVFSLYFPVIIYSLLRWINIL